MKHHLLKITLNLLAVFVLISLVAAPFYFAHKSTDIAGVTSQSAFLLISQIEKFPQMKFSQDGTKYTLALPNSANAYLGVLILTNPTGSTKTYSIESRHGIFFGENLEDQISSVSLPSGTSIPISIFSREDKEVEFKIIYQ